MSVLHVARLLSGLEGGGRVSAAGVRLARDGGYRFQRGAAGHSGPGPVLSASILRPDGETEREMVRWATGEQTVQYLVGSERLESFEAGDLAALADALVGRAALRVEVTATAALAGGDIDGAFVAAYDAYRMAAEALLARQALRPTGDRGSHTSVEDAVSAQFRGQIPAFTKTTFARFRETRHSAQYYDPSAPSITRPDASWAIEKATEALSGVKALLAASPPERFTLAGQ
jgi:hypothetical protein